MTSPSTLQNLKNYNMDWTLSVWRADSDTEWIKTVQKVAKYSVVTLMIIAAIEIGIKNLLIVTTVKIITAIRAQISTSPQEETVSTPLPVVETTLQETSATPIEEPQEEVLLETPPPDPQTEVETDPPPTPVEALPELAPTPPIIEPQPEPGPPINGARVGVLGAAVCGTVAVMGWPVVAAAAGAAAIGGAILHNTDRMMPEGPNPRPSACRNIFTSGRDRMYGGLNSVKNYLYTNPK